MGPGALPGPTWSPEPGSALERPTNVMKTLFLLLLLTASTSACSFGGGSAAPASTARPTVTAVQRAVYDLRHARFGPYTGDATPSLLRNIRCESLSSSRVRCHATWQGRRTKQIVFGVKPSGALYVIVAGPLAIS